MQKRFYVMVVLLVAGVIGLWIAPATCCAKTSRETLPPRQAEPETPTEVILIPQKPYDPLIDLENHYKAVQQTDVPEEEDTLLKKVEPVYELVDVTGKSSVRMTAARVGVDYSTSDRVKIGIEASQELSDRQDEKAWGKSTEPESEAKVKYKVAF